ncbi:MAG: TetR/AcrR family transcriptional regulator [Clostridium sp.]|uniref:TetR/AcrR family transcriptional regulator n=1 Tax=Clostridium sp. TaxID=1506 RepID=UPI003021B0F7
MKDTRETIIYEALTLFSRRGYDGVSMRDVATSVGIKAPSLYNHFKSKEDIFDGIISAMSKRYENAMAQISVPRGEIEEVAGIYTAIEQSQLQEIAKGLFLYFWKDDFAAKFRRMLIMEQYKNTMAGNTFQNYFIDGALKFQSYLFTEMIHREAFRDCDPYIMALHFYAPIFLLLNKYDHDKENETEALSILAKHVKQFSEIYVK